MSVINRSAAGRRRVLFTNLHVRLTPVAIDLFSTILMGLGTSLAAWSGFQAEQWYLRNSNSLLVANIEARNALRLSLTANQKSLLDASMFLQYFEALQSKEPARAKFIEDHLRPEFSGPFHRWLESRSAKDAPHSPIEAPYYKVKEREEAAAKSEIAADAVQTAFAAQKTARAYSFTAVLFTIVLFLGGITVKLSSAGQKSFVTWLSAAVVALALVRMFQLPLAP